MKTDDLIAMLSTQAGPAPKVSILMRLLPASIAGGLVSVFLVLAILGLIPTPMFAEIAPWIKIFYSSTLALTAAFLMAKLSRPGSSSTQLIKTLVCMVSLMASVGLISYLLTPERERTTALLGHSWLVCPWFILALSLPLLVGSFWTVKGLAPTQLSLTGGACGLFSGSMAALAYALACTETATPFIAVWYTLGIVLCSALGALLGPKLLNW